MLPICPLGWTLDYEMFFYLCFAAALRWRRGPAISAVATALIALVLAGALVPLPWPLAYWAQSITLDFAAGMLLARIRLSGWRLGAPVALGLAAACLAAAWLFVPSIDAAQAWRGLFWGVPATGIVAARRPHRHPAQRSDQARPRAARRCVLLALPRPHGAVHRPLSRDRALDRVSTASPRRAMRLCFSWPRSRPGSQSMPGSRSRSPGP